MDVIKTSLIIGIAVTFYYLLLQWPTEAKTYQEVSNLDSKINTLNESDRSLSEPLTTFSEPSDVEDSIPAAVGETFVIENDDLLLNVDAKTGRFVYSELKNISKEKDQKLPFQILGKTLKEDRLVENLYFANSGFYTQSQGYLDPQFSDMRIEKKEDSSTAYYLEGSSGGLNFQRKILFASSGYRVDVEDTIISGLGEKITVTPYVVIERDDSTLDSNGWLYTYLGPVFSSTKDNYEKYDFGDIRDSSYQNKSLGGWVALIQHYFLSAWVPDQSEEYLYQARYGDRSDRYSLGYTSKDNVISYGESITTKNTLFVGPKLPDQLKDV